MTRTLALVLLLLGPAGIAVAQEQASTARIMTGLTRPADCLAAVHVHTVDGAPAALAAAGFELPQGRHVLQAAARVDLRPCPVDARDGAGPVPPLEADFIAGRTYYVGLDHRSPEPADWRLVVWKIENASGEVLLERFGDEPASP